MTNRKGYIRAEELIGKVDTRVDDKTAEIEALRRGGVSKSYHFDSTARRELLRHQIDLEQSTGIFRPLVPTASSTLNKLRQEAEAYLV